MQRAIFMTMLSLAVFICFSSLAHTAAVISSSPLLPQKGYKSPDDVHASYPNYAVLVNHPDHSFFFNVIKFHSDGLTQTEHFDSTLTGNVVLVGQGPGGSDVTVPVSLSGPVTIVLQNKYAGNDPFSPELLTGSFDTEMTSMLLTGTVFGVPVTVRESPTLASLGHTSVTDIGGGLYAIDSFFDIFSELSIGNAFFDPSAGSTRMEMVPEPSAMALVGIAVACVGLFARRRSLR